MNGHVVDLENETQNNSNFRKVLYTTKLSQLVLMSLKPGEEIGEEIHELDQFIRVETGEGKVFLNETEHDVSDGFSVVIPAGIKHNLINTSESDLKLYTVYSPPEHKEGTIHTTRDEALQDLEDEFDGVTSE